MSQYSIILRLCAYFELKDRFYTIVVHAIIGCLVRTFQSVASQLMDYCYKLFINRVRIKLLENIQKNLQQSRTCMIHRKPASIYREMPTILLDEFTQKFQELNSKFRTVSIFMNNLWCMKMIDSTFAIMYTILLACERLAGELVYHERRTMIDTPFICTYLYNMSFLNPNINVQVTNKLQNSNLVSKTFWNTTELVHNLIVLITRALDQGLVVYYSEKTGKIEAIGMVKEIVKTGVTYAFLQIDKRRYNYVKYKTDQRSDLEASEKFLTPEIKQLKLLDSKEILITNLVCGVLENSARNFITEPQLNNKTLLVGESYLFAGENGAGKTTCIENLISNRKTDHVYINNQPISEYHPRQFALINFDVLSIHEPHPSGSEFTIAELLLTMKGGLVDRYVQNDPKNFHRLYKSPTVDYDLLFTIAEVCCCKSFLEQCLTLDDEGLYKGIKGSTGQIQKLYLTIHLYHLINGKKAYNFDTMIIALDEVDANMDFTSALKLFHGLKTLAKQHGILFLVISHHSNVHDEAGESKFVVRHCSDDTSLVSSEVPCK